MPDSFSLGHTFSPLAAFLRLYASQCLSLLVFFVVAPNGDFKFSPTLATLLVELARAATGLILGRLTSSPLDDPTLRVTDDEPTPSSRINKALTSKALAQLGSLSLLHVFAALLTCAATLFVSLSTLALVHASSTIVSGIIAMCYLAEPFTAQQWLVVLIHTAGLVATQWNACASASLAPVWIYTLLGGLVLMKQVIFLWERAIIRHSGLPTHMITTITGLYGVALSLWMYWWLPTDMFSLSIRKNIKISVAGTLRSNEKTADTTATATTWNFDSFPRLALYVVVQLCCSLITTPVLANATKQASSTLASLATLGTIYFADLFVGSTTFTVSVFVGTLTVAITAFLFLVFASESAIRAQPIYQKHMDSSVAGALTSCLPDFVVVKCGWRQVVAWAVVVFFVMALIQSSTWDSSDLLEVTPRGKVPPSSTLFNKTTSAPLSRPLETPTPVLVSHTRSPTTSDNAFDWLTRGLDDEEEMDALMDAFMTRRGPETLRNKSVAICISGDFRPTPFNRDLEWLQVFYKTFDTYDLFAWLGPNSTPYNTGVLYPRTTSMVRNKPTPNGFHRRYRNRHGDNDDWVTNLWGFGHCSEMIQNHVDKTDAHYDFVLMTLPNTSFIEHPLPKPSTWKKNAINFIPHPDHMMEKAIWGPFKPVIEFAPLLYSSLMTWTGSRNAGEYARALAKHNGNAINEIEYD